MPPSDAGRRVEFSAVGCGLVFAAEALKRRLALIRGSALNAESQGEEGNRDEDVRREEECGVDGHFKKLPDGFPSRGLATPNQFSVSVISSPYFLRISGTIMRQWFESLHFGVSQLDH